MAYRNEMANPQEVETDQDQGPDVMEFLDQVNIAENLDQEKLDEIGKRVIEDFEIDLHSRSDWERTNKDAMDLAKLTVKHKTFPFDGASNVIYPMITQAAIQFHARAYPNIVQGQNVVKSKSMGKDPEGTKSARGMRIAEYMNWQLLCQSDEWEEDLDKALFVLPIVGCFFRKTYYSAVNGRNVSKVVYAQDLVVNNKATSLDSAARVSEMIEFRPNEYIEQVRAGNFLEIDLGDDTGEDIELTYDTSHGSDANDEDNPHIFIEQHCWLDLDDDDYKEPYIVTVHKPTQKVVRISARFKVSGIKTNRKGQIVKVEPDHYYTKFGFLPAPDGSFYDWGFGQLLSPINRTINTTINQLLDAGTLHNTGGGFIAKGLALKTRNKEGRHIRFGVGEWKTIDATGDDLRKSIVPLPTKEPSMVLFQLLGTMIDIGEKLSSVTDVLQGQQPMTNTPAATTLALIEQGMKVFTAIYKRIYRSLKKEFSKLYELNRLYIDPDEYAMVLDDDQANPENDFKNDYDVYPVGDPNEVSDMQKIMKAQTLMQFMGQGLNDKVIMDRVLEALSVPDVNELKEEVPQPPTPPEVIKDAHDYEIKNRELSLKEREIALAEQKLPYELQGLQAKALKDTADAESKEPGIQADQYAQAIFALTEQVQILQAAIAQMQGGMIPNGPIQGAVSGMEAQPSDQGSIQDVGGAAGIPQGGFGDGLNAQPGISGGDIPLDQLDAGGNQGLE